MQFCPDCVYFNVLKDDVDRSIILAYNENVFTRQNIPVFSRPVTTGSQC